MACHTASDHLDPVIDPGSFYSLGGKFYFQGHWAEHFRRRSNQHKFSDLGVGYDADSSNKFHCHHLWSYRGFGLCFCQCSRRGKRVRDHLFCWYESKEGILPHGNINIVCLQGTDPCSWKYSRIWIWHDEPFCGIHLPNNQSSCCRICDHCSQSKRRTT